MIAAKRALQLQRGAKPRSDIGIRKPTVVAMLESLEQKVSYELPDKPKEKKSRK
jgi:DNA-directed RNA polymerase subunit K/omega